MAPTTTSEHGRPGGLTTQTYVSIGLVILLIGAAVTAGQFMQRVAVIESELRDVRLEIRQVRDLLLTPRWGATPQPQRGEP